MHPPKNTRPNETAGDESLATTQRFTAALLHWHRAHNRRAMPWKGEKDPYKIWISEIILQQTRVEQGRAYYERFVASLPTIEALAAAPEATVFKLWEGLGYYSRARNLMHAARTIEAEHGGTFPRSYEAILSLKGIGPYTAAAIASFAYGLPHAVVDGNVLRVVSRITAYDTPVDSTAGRKHLDALAQLILHREDPAAQNQAIMDFGATVCTPVPKCPECFFNKDCLALLRGEQTRLPIKGAKPAKRRRWMLYFLLECGGEIAVQQRTAKDIWQGLWELPGIETEAAVEGRDWTGLLTQHFSIHPEDYTVEDAAAKAVHLLTHQEVHLRFVHLCLTQKPPYAGWTWISWKEREAYAFSKPLGRYLSSPLSPKGGT